MITIEQATTGYTRAMADVQAAANRIAGLQNRARTLEQQAHALDKNPNAAAAAALIEAVDAVARDLVIAHADYAKQTELAAIVGAIKKYAVSAKKLRDAGDTAKALDHERIVERLGEALRELSNKKIPIKVPGPTTANLDGLFDSIGKAVGAKLKQVGTWARDNAPVIGGAVGAVVGTIVLGPGAGTAAGAAIGSAVGQVIKNTKHEVQEQAAPPPAPERVDFSAFLLGAWKELWGWDAPQNEVAYWNDQLNGWIREGASVQQAQERFVAQAKAHANYATHQAAKARASAANVVPPQQSAGVVNTALVRTQGGNTGIVPPQGQLRPGEQVIRPPRSNTALVAGGAAAALLVGVVAAKKLRN